MRNANPSRKYKTKLFSNMLKTLEERMQPTSQSQRRKIKQIKITAILMSISMTTRSASES